MKIEGDKLYCYVPGRAVARRLCEDVEILDPLIHGFGIEVKPSKYKTMTPEDKVEVIVRHAEHLGQLGPSPWYGTDPIDIVVANMFRFCPDEYVFNLFGGVSREQELRSETSNWLQCKRGAKAIYEVSMSMARVDVLGYRKETNELRGRLIGVELKNTIKDLKRGVHQMSLFGLYANEVYLACTPHMIVQYLYSHFGAKGVHRWDANLLNDQLGQSGIGLLVVRFNEVFHVVSPKERTPDRVKHDELLALLKSRGEL